MSNVGEASCASTSVTVASSLPVTSYAHSDPLIKNTLWSSPLVSAEVRQSGSVMGQAVAVSSGMQQSQMQGGVSNSNLANISRSFTMSHVPNSIAKQTEGTGLSPSPTMDQTVGAKSGIPNTWTNNANSVIHIGQFNPNKGAVPMNDMGNADVASNMRPAHEMMGNRPDMKNGPLQGGDTCSMTMDIDNTMIRNSYPLANPVLWHVKQPNRQPTQQRISAEQSLGRVGVGTATRGSQALAEDPVKHRHYQRQLALLLHASNCKWGEAAANGEVKPCTLPQCRTMKYVLNHISKCQAGRSCQVAYCASSKQIMCHWKNCTGNDCPENLPLNNALDRKQNDLIRAYEEALKSGKVRCNRSRIMVVGPAGIGKTSLIRRLTGQPFNCMEKSTVGTEQNTVKKNLVSGWKLDNDTKKDDVAECMALHKQLEEQEKTKQWGIRNTDAKEQSWRKQPKTRDETFDKPSNSSATPSVEIHHEAPSSSAVAEVQDSSQNALKRKSSPEHHSADKRHKALAQELTAVAEVADSSQHALKCKSSPEHHSADKRHKALAQELTKKRITNATSTANDISYSIWDFGGQVIYYITHPLFLSWRSLYIVVFQFHLDFNTEPPRAEEINIQGATPRTHRTILDLLHFWLMSIYVHAVPPRDRERFEPKILLVGTFRHEPSITEEDVKCKISQIKKMVRGKPYAKQIHSEILQIDNSSSSEKEVTYIQEQIDKLVKESAYMQEDLPIRWRTFSDEMRALTRDTLLLDEARTAVTDVRIIEDIEVEAVLEFYHNIGDLVYHQGCELIVLNPQILNNFVSNIITVVDDEKLEGELGDDWKILIEKGILRRTLLEAVWESNKGKPNELKYLIDMMVRFDLICKIPEDPQLKTDILQGCYFVPCCSRPELGEVQKPNKDNMDDEFRFIIDFHKFLPDGFLHRLYVRMALWSMIGRKIPYKPTFHCREMLFYIDELHRVLMTNTVEGDDAHRIKVLIFRLKPEGTPGKRRKKLPIHLKRDVTLEDLKMTWARRISYSLGLPCTKCRDKGKRFSLVSLDTFLNCEDAAHCGECDDAIHAGRVKQALLCSPARATEDSSRNRKDLDIESKILKLSQEMPAEKYFELCNNVHIGYNAAHRILVQFSNDYARATVHCLVQWKTRKRDCLSKLKTILRKIEVGYLVKYIE